MVHVNYFLQCIKLETGGNIIAWFHMIAYAIVPFTLIAGVCLHGWVPTGYGPTLTFASIVAFLLTIICIAVVIIAYRSRQAIATRNHIRMFEMMALMFAMTCFCLYTFVIQLWLWPIQCLITVFFAVIYFYLFIVIYSLYRAFRKEYEREIIRQEKALA